MADNSEDDMNDSVSESFDLDEEGDGEETVSASQQLKARNLELRRKIEDRMERKRLRDELGYFDDDWWPQE